MSDFELRFRQIHLDFHTSEAIEGIGANFDPDEFADTLDKARVDSITCFARGHHGWLYYDSTKFPERIHPHLVEKDLLAKQIDACHQRGIRAPIYTTVQWDHYTAERHPEWLQILPDGKISGTPPYEPGFYRNLCVNTPYRDFLKDQTMEVLETLPCDGFFFDIVGIRDCSCRYCREGMIAAGLEPSNQDDRMAYAKDVMDDFKRDMTAMIREVSADCTIFYNAGHVGPYIKSSADTYSHFELESLPSGGWGYMHFPITMRYARKLGLDCLSHTGKFHTTWGDFHSFKNAAALQYECFRMLALNSKCEIGDQLTPDGKICPHVYELIGSVYREVEKREPWCKQARAVTDIALVTSETPEKRRNPSDTLAGAVGMLIEGAHQFDVIDAEMDFAPYKVVILPGDVEGDEALAAKIEAYLAAGGAVIATHEAALNAEKTAFVTDAFGVTYQGPAPYTLDYILPTGDVGRSLPETEHVMYDQGAEVTAAEDADVLADVIVPFFNRTYKHFCSHRNTPSSGKVGYPGIVRKGNAIYIAEPIFAQYKRIGSRWCKTIALNVLDLLLAEPLVRHDGPSTVEATLNEQSTESRRVLHLLHYIPERRCDRIDTIEDVIPLYDLGVSVRADSPVTSVTCVPQGETLEFTEKDGRINFILPKLEGHQMIELA